MGVVDQMVEDGVCDGGVADLLVLPSFLNYSVFEIAELCKILSLINKHFKLQASFIIHHVNKHANRK
jgi:hypothetical protein